MTNQKRFRAALAFEPTDRPCHVEWGFGEESFPRRRSEDLFDHLGVTRFGCLRRQAHKAAAAWYPCMTVYRGVSAETFPGEPEQ